MYLKLHNKHKLDVIAHALTRCGITIWHGIPEQIVQDLHTAGYKIKKRKNFKIVSQDVDPRRIPAAKLKSQHQSDKDIYL
jgi:hypothetical protein